MGIFCKIGISKIGILTVDHAVGVSNSRKEHSNSFSSSHNKPCHVEHCLHAVKTEQLLISNTTISGTFSELPAWKLMGKNNTSQRQKKRVHNQALKQRNKRVLWKSGYKHTGRVKILENLSTPRPSRENDVYPTNNTVLGC